jgi:cytochrome c-type biogenesis protein CcmH/NrfG
MAPQQTSSTTWALIAIACLFLGLAVGYVLFRGQPAGAPGTAPAVQASAPAAGTPGPALFDEQAARALRNILARDPGNVQANTQLGNLFFDAGRYAEAVAPYEKAFAVDSKNANLSTDLGTALWYSGRTDEALAQFQKSLAITPNHPQTLFNLGIVRRDGKHDLAGAVKAWEQLLATDPNYVDRDKVQQLLAQAKQQLAEAPAAPGRPAAR